MNYKIPFGPDDYDWFLTVYEHSLRKHRAIFLKMVYKKLFDADTPLEAAMALMEVDSPVELAQKLLQVDTPLEAAMRLMEVDSPIELALKVIQTEEQCRELLERLQQRSYQTATAST